LKATQLITNPTSETEDSGRKSSTDPLASASCERGEGKADDQPATGPPPESKNPASGSIEETSETPTRKQQIAEAAEKPPTPAQSAHHEEKSEPSPLQPISSADTNNRQQDDPPNADDQRR